MTTEVVTSDDGTHICIRRTGSGPPLVIVPGTLAPPALYAPLIALLSPMHEVFLITRRGYGQSGPGPRPCRTAHHCADLAAVLRRIGEPSVVFGHSFGGLITLGALAGIPDTAARVRRIVLYEPPAAMLGDRLVPMRDTCRALIAAGRPADAVRHSFEVSGSPQLTSGATIEQTAHRLRDLAPGLLSDLECVTAMTPDDARWPGVTTPALLLSGDLSGEEYAESMRLISGTLPHARHEVLFGQAHFPENMRLVAEHVVSG